MATRPRIIPARVMASSALIAQTVRNPEGETLGSVKEVMVDLHTGRVAYVVLSFGGMLGVGDKLFAIPWGALTLAADEPALVLNATKDQLKNAPGFDKDDWPDFADPTWHASIHEHYRVEPYWSA